MGTDDASRRVSGSVPSRPLECPVPRVGGRREGGQETPVAPRSPLRPVASDSSAPTSRYLLARHSTRGPQVELGRTAGDTTGSNGKGSSSVNQ